MRERPREDQEAWNKGDEDGVRVRERVQGGRSKR